MSIANPNYSFTVENFNGTYTIHWKAAKLGIKFALPLLWPSLVVGLLIALSRAGSTDGVSSVVISFVWWSLVCAAGIMVFINYGLRRGGSFSFNKSGFSKGSQTFDNAHILGVYVKSPKGERIGTLTYTTVSGFGVAGTLNAMGQGLNQISAQSGRAMREAMREKNYKLCCQYGEREITLARNLTAFTAKAMLTKIDELI